MFFAMSGSDANEGAIKLAAAYHKLKGNKNKKKIVSFKESYHGSTYLTQGLGLIAMTDPYYSLEGTVYKNNKKKLCYRRH